jgi:hypothetical protein
VTRAPRGVDDLFHELRRAALVTLASSIAAGVLTGVAFGFSAASALVSTFAGIWSGVAYARMKNHAEKRLITDASGSKNAE